LAPSLAHPELRFDELLPRHSPASALAPATPQLSAMLVPHLGAEAVTGGCARQPGWMRESIVFS